MIPVPTPVANVSVSLDPGSGMWRVEAEAPRCLRAWRWGERRRLVAACSRGGRFDGSAFAAAVAATLYDPPPPPELAPLHALIALDLLGVGHGAAPSALGAAEARLAARFGWLPSAIAEEPAPALDSLLANFDPGVATSPGHGWNSIRLVEAPDA